MRMPVNSRVAEILFARHHVAHRSGFQSRDFFFRDHLFKASNDLRFRQTSQNHLSPLEGKWHYRARGGRIEANRTAHLRIPELREIELRHPRSLHETHEAI